MRAYGIRALKKVARTNDSTVRGLADDGMSFEHHLRNSFNPYIKITNRSLFEQTKISIFKTEKKSSRDPNHDSRS